MGSCKGWVDILALISVDRPYWSFIHYSSHLYLVSRDITCCVVAKDKKKLREKVTKIASKVEEEDFTGDLEMV